MVAEHCGVSVMTVSRALRGEGTVASATAERILTAARALGYDPAHNQMARQMVMRRHGQTSLNRVFALFLPPFFYRAAEARYFGPIFDGVMTAAMLAHFAVLTHYVTYPASEEHPYPYTQLEQLPTAFSHGDVDGVILVTRPHEQAHIVDLLRRERNFGEKPIVTLIEPTPGCSAVLTDDAQSAHAAMTHLLALGHRRVVHFVNAADDYDCRLHRLAAYQQAVHDMGLNPAEVLRYCPWDWDAADASLQGAVAFLIDHPEITAILAHHDQMAQLLYEALMARGRRIPEDFSLIGHDDTLECLAGAGELRLSTIRLPLADVGRTAANLLIGHLTGEVGAPATRWLPTEFVARTSTGSAVST
jgi:LacI family transcriptional regulator